MLRSHSQTKISPYRDLYDLIIPSNHKLRRLNELVDFRFVLQELRDKYCLDNGRDAYSPVLMFKLLLLKCMFELSDRGVVERSSTDMAFKYFLGLNPEENVPEASSLSFFRRQRLKDDNLLDLLIGKSVQIAKKHGLIKGKTLYVDATHTLSRYVSRTPHETLDLLFDRLYKNIRKQPALAEDFMKTLPPEPCNNRVHPRIEYAREVAKAVIEHKILSQFDNILEAARLLEEGCDDIIEYYYVSYDKDARLGHKSRVNSFHGYKTHISMTEERIITSAVVTPGNADDGGQLPALIEKAQANLGEDHPVKEVVGDGAYSSSENLQQAQEKDIEIYSKPHPALYKGNDLQDDGFYLNKDAGMYVCPAGHQSISRCKHKRQKGKGNARIGFRFSSEHCSVCKLKDSCCPNTKSKTYYIPDRSPQQERLMKIASTDEYRQKMATRYIIEAKNAELKNVYGYNKAIASGIKNMTLQGAMTIFVANMSRIMRLLGK